MIAVWIGIVLVVAALVVYAGRLAGVFKAVTWPEEEPLNPHDNRSLDPHLKHLARVLGTDAVDEAHRELVGITRQLVFSTGVFLRLGSADAAWDRLGPDVISFLQNPPKDPERYRHRLAAVLPKIEAL